MHSNEHPRRGSRAMGQPDQTTKNLGMETGKENADRPKRGLSNVQMKCQARKMKKVHPEETQDQPLMDIQRSLTTKARRTRIATAWVAETTHGRPPD